MLNYSLVNLKRKNIPGISFEIGDVVCVNHEMVTWLSGSYSNLTRRGYRFKVVSLKNQSALFVGESGELEVSEK